MNDRIRKVSAVLRSIAHSDRKKGRPVFVTSLIGLFFITLSIVDAASSFLFLSRARSTPGTVQIVEVRTVTPPKRGSREAPTEQISYDAKINYMVNQTPYTIPGPLMLASFIEPGAKAPVLYDPHNPQNASVDILPSLWGRSLILLVIGAASLSYFAMKYRKHSRRLRRSAYRGKSSSHAAIPV